MMNIVAGLQGGTWRLVRDRPWLVAVAVAAEMLQHAMEIRLGMDAGGIGGPADGGKADGAAVTLLPLPAWLLVSSLLIP